MAQEKNSFNIDDLKGLTYEQAAEHLNIKKSTVKGLVWKGVLKQIEKTEWHYSDRPLIDCESVKTYAAKRNQNLINAWVKRKEARAN